ncbi:hypothetical protein [Streptomyces lateritius]|uniref:hypothetical protein n=1 Tax=Streptomyces lateritius TaxID=67313 RepID=UPI001676B238|nr:hypothetical protein [Streptomyces lateritius]GGT72417.1 hypothetical protein GCM10010272_14480 [Streptomyces lateritius]
MESHSDETRTNINSARRRQSELNKIERNFDAKVAFLVERGTLDAALGPVLEKLHKYRNEM